MLWGYATAYFVFKLHIVCLIRLNSMLYGNVTVISYVIQHFSAGVICTDSDSLTLFCSYLDQLENNVVCNSQ